MPNRKCKNCEIEMTSIFGIQIYWCHNCGILLEEKGNNDIWNEPEINKWSPIESEILVDEQHYNIMLKDGRIRENVEYWNFNKVFIGDIEKKDIKINDVEKFQKVK